MLAASSIPPVNESVICSCKFNNDSLSNLEMNDSVGSTHERMLAEAFSDTFGMAKRDARTVHGHSDVECEGFNCGLKQSQQKIRYLCLNVD